MPYARVNRTHSFDGSLVVGARRVSGRDYGQEVLALMPSSFWSFGQASGNAADLAGAVTLTANGTLTYGVAGPISDGLTAINFGESGYFDGGDNYGFTGNTAFSIGVWVHALEVPASSFLRIIQKRQTDGNGIQGWALLFRPSSAGLHSGELTIERWLNGVTEACHSNVVPPLNQWVFVVVTYDGATLRMYFNGVEVSNAASALSIATNAAPLRVGANENGNNRWAGRLARPFVVSDRALSAAEISALYAARTLTTAQARRARVRQAP